ncbi:hypothetical protein ACFQ6N_17315 [Kitasatospora sp. NPDC056446]|uniref:hypothetical protein n=1 Tax=Kitasatospora sp. NPDC056446 TaxID=3345819 RepID=UPI0036ADA15A
MEPAAEDGNQPPEPLPPELLPPGYREIQAAIEKATDGLRAEDVCQALGLGAEPRHAEGARAKLKRRVTRGILTEPEPGLFALAKPTPGTPEADSG